MTIIFNDPSDDIIITATKLRSKTTQSLTLDASDNSLMIDASNITLNNNDLSINTIHASDFKILHPHTKNTHILLKEYFNIISKGNIDLTNNVLDASLNNVDIAGNLRLNNISSKLIFNNGSTISISNDDALLIDPSPVNDSSGTVIIQGDLEVLGIKTIIDSSVFDISDKTLNIAYGATSISQADQAGIVIGTSDLSLSIKYDNASEKFVFSKGVDTSGDLTYTSLNTNSITVGNSTIKDGVLGNITIGTDLISSNKDVKLFTSKSTFVIENSANILTADISDVSHKWISPPGYINSINLNSIDSYVLVEFNVNYMTSPEAEQTISFKVTRGLSAEDPPVFQDCSLGSNKGVTLNDIYNGSFIDTDPSSTPYEIIGGNILNKFENSYASGSGNNRTTMCLSDDGSIIVIANKDTGEVKIHKKNNNLFNSWSFQSITITPQHNATNFGKTVSISNDGKILAISESSDGTSANGQNNHGCVNIYTILDSSGNLESNTLLNAQLPKQLTIHELLRSERDHNKDQNNFGSYIRLSGDGTTIAVYAANINDNAVSSLGYVFIYRYNTNSEKWEPMDISRNGISNDDAINNTHKFVSGLVTRTNENRITDSEQYEYISYGRELTLSYDGNIIFLPYFNKSKSTDPNYRTFHVDIYLHNKSSTNFDYTNTVDMGQVIENPCIYPSGNGHRFVVGNSGINENLNGKILNGKKNVYIFDTSDNWHTITLTEVGIMDVNSSYLGISVCLSYDGNVLFVGDPTNQPGYIYIYEYNSSGWEKKNTIYGADNSYFGSKFVISPNSAILAANNGGTSSKNTGEDVILYNVKNATPTHITSNPNPVLYSLHYKLNCPAYDNIDTSFGILSNGYNNILLQELYG